MKVVLQTIFVFFLILSCNQKSNNFSLNPNHKFEKIKETDSTSFLQWTNGKIYFRSSKPIDNYYIDSKTYLKWSNEKYMCLTHPNGSDTWTDLILPFTINEVKFYENPLIYDKENGIVIREIDSLNYKLIAENLDSHQEQLIGSDWSNCSSVFPHYCIDSINIQNKELYVEWIVPNKIDKLKQKENKKIKLNL